MWGGGLKVWASEGGQPMRVHLFSCLSDNYGVLIHDPLSGTTAAIDAPEEGPILEALEATGWHLSHILVTHSHHDHIGGIGQLRAAFAPLVIAPEKAKAAVPNADRYVSEGDVVKVGGMTCEVMELPGHCRDHVGYYFAKERAAFVGDVLFALGCGRVFDGDYAAMWASLQRLMALPDETDVYFGHEYTLSNARFALSVDPHNVDLKAQVQRATVLRERGDFTLPTSIGAEKAANPFLRAGLHGMAANIGMQGAAAEDVFRELRERKNRF